MGSERCTVAPSAVCVSVPVRVATKSADALVWLSSGTTTDANKPVCAAGPVVRDMERLKNQPWANDFEYDTVPVCVGGCPRFCWLAHAAPMEPGTPKL